MTVVNLNSGNFDSIISRDGIVMVDCWASWCKACKPFTPVFERIAGRYAKHTFGKLDTQEEQEIVSKLGVKHIPTLLLYRDGILLFQQPGYFEEDELDDIISQAEALDMDIVKAEIAAESDTVGDEQHQ